MDRLTLIEKFAAKMTQERREDLSSKSFAVPASKAKKLGVSGEIKGEAKGKYPIPDEKHARNALARVSQHGTPGEREAVRKKVYAKYPQLRESFEESHGGESPTSKENVKKEEQGGIGKEGSAPPRPPGGGLLPRKGPPIPKGMVVKLLPGGKSKLVTREEAGLGKDSCAGVKMAAMADELEKIAATEAKLKRMAEKIDALKARGQEVPSALEDAFKHQMKKWETLSGPRIRAFGEKARAARKVQSAGKALARVGKASLGGLKRFGWR
jgi:hypothetical protein